MRRARGVRRASAVIAAGSIALVLGACGAGEVAATGDGRFSGPWAQVFADAHAAAQSDFARTVLEDGVITDREVVEMWQLIQECTRAAGHESQITTEIGPTGVSPNVQMPPAHSEDEAARISAALNDCRRQYDGDLDNVNAITEIVRQQRFNAAAPLDEEGQRRLTFACFRREGFLDDAVSFEEFTQMAFPCTMTTTEAGLEAAMDSGCWTRIIPLDGRDIEEIREEQKEAGTPLRGNMSNDMFIFEMNPDHVWEAPTFPDGRDMVSGDAEMCWISPNA